jgi:protein TonB
MVKTVRLLISQATILISQSTTLSIALHVICLTLGLALLDGRREPAASDSIWVSLQDSAPAPGPAKARAQKKVRTPPTDAAVSKADPVASTEARADTAPEARADAVTEARADAVTEARADTATEARADESPSEDPSDLTGEAASDTTGGLAPRDYFQRLLAEIARHKRYPRLARVRGWEGRVVVEFTVGADGRVERVNLQNGSPHAILNEAALDLIRSRERFEAPPAGSATPLVLRVPVVYSLQGA